MTKPPKNSGRKQDHSHVILLESQNEEQQTEMRAQAICDPSVQAAATIKTYNKHDDTLNVNAVIKELKSQNKALREGGINRVEDILLSQAHSLDVLFGEFVRRAKGCEYIDSLKTYMNLGLRAQSQCRATLEALAEMKNPRPYIQNNKAQYQQVNNGGTYPEVNKENNTRAHAGRNSKSTNGLLEDQTHEQEWLDGGTPETASGTDKELETVGA